VRRCARALSGESSVEPARVLDAIAADDHFHGVLLAAADNAELAAALERVMPKVRRLEYAQFSSLGGRASVRQHEAIVAACARRCRRGGAAGGGELARPRPPDRGLARVRPRRRCRRRGRA
jgi:DNA-binding GntR family transcriptional regulator